MEKYSTISIKPSTKEKLKLIVKKQDSSYDKVLNEVLGDGGLKIDDVIKVEREQIAEILKYFEFGNAEKFVSKEVTYKMLRMDPIGTVYMANENPNRNVEYVNDICELCYRNGDDVIVMRHQIHYKNGNFDGFKEVLHFNLF